MKLETEFRVYLQRMQLEKTFQNAAVPRLIDRLQPFEPAPSVWVKLVQPPSIFSADEALLLCQYCENCWIAWVPDYGELMLSSDDFYELPTDCKY